MTEFETWLTKNRAHLSTYNPEEISHLALSCGFSAAEIIEGLSHGFMNLRTRTTFKQRQDFHVGRELKTAAVHCGNPDLEEQWYCLAKKVMWDIDFQEAV